MKIRKEKFYVFEECFQGTWAKKKAPATLNYAANAFQFCISFILIFILMQRNLLRRLWNP